MSKLQKKGTLPKMWRLLEKIQHIGRKSLSAQEHNWNYNKTQKINGNDQKVFYNTTLLVNERPIKFFIDSGSPVTLIPNCLFNKTTEREPLITCHRDVNHQRNEFTGQTKAKVKNQQQDDRTTVTDDGRNNITVDGIRLDASAGNLL